MTVQTKNGTPQNGEILNMPPVEATEAILSSGSTDDAAELQGIKAEIEAMVDTAPRWQRRVRR